MGSYCLPLNILLCLPLRYHFSPFSPSAVGNCSRSQPLQAARQNSNSICDSGDLGGYRLSISDIYWRSFHG